MKTHLQRQKVDMTQGNIMMQVIRFALPICFGNILQQLYNTVDTAVIGNYCGRDSLAAVGTCGQPVEVFLCIFIGLGTGVSIKMAQFVGNKDTESARKGVATAISFMYMCAIPMTVLGLFFAPYILKLMNVPSDAWDYCIAYLNIIFIGSLGNVGYNMNAGILRGLGDSGATIWFLLASCIVNIVFDLLFVGVFGWDVSGAAGATILAMFVSWFLSILYIKKKYPELGFTFLPHRVDKEMLSGFVRIGLPLGLNNSLYSVGHIFMQTLTNDQGTIFMAACSVATKVTGIANVAITSFSSAATTFAGQNFGAKNYVRLRKGGVMIPFASGLITAISGITITIFCVPILGVFTKDDPQVLEMAVKYIQIVLPLTWTYAIFNGIISYVNGLGEIKYPTIINLLMLWAVRIPVAYLIAKFVDGTLIMISIPVSFIFGMLSMLAFFLTKKWRSIKELSRTQAKKTV